MFTSPCHSCNELFPYGQLVFSFLRRFCVCSLALSVHCNAYECQIKWIQVPLTKLPDKTDEAWCKQALLILHLAPRCVGITWWRFEKRMPWNRFEIRLVENASIIRWATLVLINCIQSDGRPECSDSSRNKCSDSISKMLECSSSRIPIDCRTILELQISVNFFN